HITRSSRPSPSKSRAANPRPSKPGGHAPLSLETSVNFPPPALRNRWLGTPLLAELQGETDRSSRPLLVSAANRAPLPMPLVFRFSWGSWRNFPFSFLRKIPGLEP